MGKHVEIDLVEDAGTTADNDPAATIVDEDRPVTAGVVNVDVVDEDADPLDRLPPHAVTNGDGSVTLPLKFPRELQVKKAGKVRTDKFDALTFHRLNGADQRAIASTSDDMMSIVAFARSTRLSQAVMTALFDKMDGADIASGGLVLNSFFATGRKTGR